MRPLKIDKNGQKCKINQKGTYKTEGVTQMMEEIKRHTQRTYLFSLQIIILLWRGRPRSTLA